MRNYLTTSVSESRSRTIHGRYPIAGFSLVELMVTLGIIVVLTVVAVPAYRTISASNSFNSAVQDISILLGQARAHAMASNTYVYVGLTEVDASVSSDANPQTPTPGRVGGRLAVVALAAKDGTRGYNILDPVPTWERNYNSNDEGTPVTPGHRLVVLSRLRRYENVHLSPSLPNPGSGAMQRQEVASSETLGHSQAASATPVAYPLGSNLDSGQYQFQYVIIFDPNGVARIQTTTPGNEIKSRLEIGLEPSQGNKLALPAIANAGQQAAIQISCLTGAIQVFQP